MAQNRFFATLLMAFAVWFQFSPATAQPMLVGSYNIRYKNGGDEARGDFWQKRCQVICDQVNFMAPDIFGAQEVLHEQLVDMLERLDGYDCIGVGRDDGMTKGEYAAIFYKKDHVQLLDHGNFWLSETPEKPNLGWDAACVRICTWGRFAINERFTLKDDQLGLKDDDFFFFNLHMDHVGKVARREAAKLVVQKIKELTAQPSPITQRPTPNVPVILTGDFNVDQDDEIYRIFVESGILKDSYDCARIRFAENGTFNSFKSDLFTKSRIDHIFVSVPTEVEAYAVLTDSYWTPDTTSTQQMKSADAPQEIDFIRYERRLPSDHYPVFVRLR